MATDNTALRSLHPDPDRLCGNCQHTGAMKMPVGVEHGTQRQPVLTRVPVCESCADAMTAGDFVELAKRNRERPESVKQE